MDCVLKSRTLPMSLLYTVTPIATASRCGSTVSASYLETGTINQRVFESMPTDNQQQVDATPE